MTSPDLVFASRRAPTEHLLAPFLTAVALTTVAAWAMQYALYAAAPFDLTGQVETLLPLARLGVLATPLIVLVRGAVASVIAWLVAGALEHPTTLRTVTAAVLTWLPLLELPALADAIAILLHPQAPITESHIRLGVDAIWQGTGVRSQLLAHTVTLPVIAFSALLARRLTTRAALGAKVAVPAALAAAAALVALPLLRL